MFISAPLNERDGEKLENKKKDNPVSFNLKSILNLSDFSIDFNVSFG
jgi:hypothetical protein